MVYSYLSFVFSFTQNRIAYSASVVIFLFFNSEEMELNSGLELTG